ncbi:MAG: amidohydrolase family protein [Pseudomonadota bacterium]|nr:amidohydrolase family protein [Pseudomonadota bacterium]
MELPTGNEQFFKMSVDSFDTDKVLVNAARQRDARGLDDVLIVDVDSHHYESESMRDIIEFIEDPVLRQLAQSSNQVNQRGSMFALGRVGYQDIGGRVTRYPLRKLEETPADGIHRDVHLTHKWMDAMGVDYSCMFPTPMLSLALHPQPEVEQNLARAYNSWLVEKVLPGSPRISSMLYLPFNDHKAAYKMVEDFGDKPGVLGFMVTSVRHKPVHDNDYMKIYGLIEEMGLPLGFHSGFNWDDPMFRTANRFIAVHALGFTWYNVIHCTNWVVNGLPERFPNLKVVWIESGVTWIPWLMTRLDNEYRMRSSECPSLKMLPSEYMKQMYYSTQPIEVPDDDEYMEAVFKCIDAENTLMYASDYPHWDMDLPSTIWDLPFLSEKAKRKILGENARDAFNMDVSARFPNAAAAE